MEQYEHNSRRTRRVQDASIIIGFLANNGNFTPVAENCHVIEPENRWDDMGNYMDEEHE